MQFRTFLFAFLSCAVIAVRGQVPAPPCTNEAREQCHPPDCRCSGVDIPRNLAPSRTPQLVYLTFDDAITTINYPFYKELFANRLNPNGHRITGSFYISHEYTNYAFIHDLYRDGHEIALHTITHTPLPYWREINESMWIKEVVEQREQMATFAAIPESEIRGMRAPFLVTGADRMYKALHDASFQYESSMPTLAQRKPGLWPYTNDYASTQECEIQPCRIGQYKGFWTSPMVDLIGDNMQPCSMADTCFPVPTKADEMYSLLLRNFNDHYSTNRAPFGIYAHSAWLNGTQEEDEVDQRRMGYERFIDYVLSLGDVYIVSVTRGIEWVKNPQDIDQSKDFPHFKVEAKPNNCPTTHSCRYPPEKTPFPSERYLFSCVTCPELYPWVGNHLGRE